MIIEITPPKVATSKTKQANDLVPQTLPFSDRKDFDGFAFCPVMGAFSLNKS